MSLSHPSSHTRIGMLRQPRKSSVWSSVGPAVPFARADLTICLKYLGKTGWTARWCHSGGPRKLRVPVAKLHARSPSPTPDLVMPFRPITSFSFLHASARDTSSSWSLKVEDVLAGVPSPTLSTPSPIPSQTRGATTLHVLQSLGVLYQMSRCSWSVLTSSISLQRR